MKDVQLLIFVKIKKFGCPFWMAPRAEVQLTLLLRHYIANLFLIVNVYCVALIFKMSPYFHRVTATQSGTELRV